MKKRMMAAVLVLMIALSLTACGGQGESSSGGTSSTTASSETQETQSSSSTVEESSTPTESGTAKFDDVTLSCLVCWNGGFKTATDQYNNDVAKAIRDKIGVTVEYEGIMMSEVEKLNLVFASGDMPDMINAPYWGGSAGETEVIKKAATEGRLIDIKDEIPKYENLVCAYDIGVVSQKYLENDLDDPQFEGARYVLPNETPSGTAESVTNWAYGVFVRGDVPEALGIDPTSIKTSDQLYDFMKQAQAYGFKDVNGNDTIVATTYHEGWDYGQYAVSFDDKVTSGDYVLNDDGSVTMSRLTDNWVNKHLFIWKLVNEGLLDKECFKQSDSQTDEKVGNGTALFAAAQYGVVINSTKLTGLYDAHPEMRYVWVGPLTYADGTQVVQIETEGRSGSPCMIFPTSCSNLDAALTYLDYVNSEEGCRLVTYGFEGDTYDFNEDNQPRMNAELTARFNEDSEGVKEELRERGIGYIPARTLLADKRLSWWGESEAFQADAENEYIKEYKTIRNVEILKGYPLNSFASSFDRYSDVAEFYFEGTTEKDYRERAYFAPTEDEARQILLDYQNYVEEQQDGLIHEFEDYMAECAASRDDVVE